MKFFFLYATLPPSMKPALDKTRPSLLDLLPRIAACGKREAEQILDRLLYGDNLLVMQALLAGEEV